MKLDLHFIYKNKKFVIDFKSSFHSNEKGNTNRLLLVGTIYKNLEDNYKTLILVRSEEDENNHYLRRLKNSGIWEVFCGNDTYEKIREYSGYNLKNWIEKNIDWEKDIDHNFYLYLKQNDLLKYLKW